MKTAPVVHATPSKHLCRLHGSITHEIASYLARITGQGMPTIHHPH